MGIRQVAYAYGFGAAELGAAGGADGGGPPGAQEVVTTMTVWQNLPPATVYMARRPRFT
ncbi:hypothetical protein [Nonomuraea sp. NPDC049129]|uniref:hypothetical protein n=1 Tax=unclassified Nonomuraea TaxID=2593643 RepID=UPI0033FA1B5B